MGLLQKAAEVRETAGSESATLNPPRARGLLARAESFLRGESGKSYPGVSKSIGRGLLARASHYREKWEADKHRADSQKASTVIAEPFAAKSSTGSPPGLLARASRFREELQQKSSTDKSWFDKTVEKHRTHGLLARAEKMHESPEAERTAQEGLLSGATQLRESEQVEKNVEPAVAIPGSEPTFPVEKTVNDVAQSSEHPGADGLPEIWPPEGEGGLHEDDEFLYDILDEPINDTQQELTPVEVKETSGGLLSRAEEMIAGDAIEPPKDTHTESYSDILQGEIPDNWPPVSNEVQGAHDDDDFMTGLLDEEPEGEVQKEEKSAGGLLARAESLLEEEKIPPGELQPEDEQTIEELPSYEDETQDNLSAEAERDAYNSSEEISHDIGTEDLQDAGTRLEDAQSRDKEETAPEEIGEVAEGGRDEDADRGGLEPEPSAEQEESEGDFPDLVYSGNSMQSEDPAADNHLTRSGTHEDPFDEWEEEAEKNAEKVAMSLSEGGALQSGSKNRYLVSSEEEPFTTRDLGDNLDSGRKLDNYLSLFDLTKELATVEEFRDFWETILYALLGQTGAEKICIFSNEDASEKGNILHPIVHSGVDIEEGLAIKPGDEIYERCIKSGGFKYAEEMGKAALSSQEQTLLGVTDAYVILPVRRQDRLFGVITISRPLSGVDYTLEDLEYANLLADIVSPEATRILNRMEHARETEDLKRRSEVQRNILSFARNASSLRNQDELYDLLAERLEKDLEVEHYSLVLLDSQEKCFRIFAGNQISTESMEKFKLRLDSELVGMISNITRVFEINSFRFNGDIVDNYTADDIALMKRYKVIPLINLNWLAGFITIHSTATPWTDFHREQAVSLSQVAAPLFANTVLSLTQKSVFRDPFSPIQDRLEQELKKAESFQSNLALIDWRVNNIRRIFGLNPGEEVVSFLSDLGHLINDIIYESDYVARTAQGRYSIILPGRGRKEAEIFVKKLKREIEGRRFLASSPVEVQYTHSVLTYPDDARDAAHLISLTD